MILLHPFKATTTNAIILFWKISFITFTFSVFFRCSMSHRIFLEKNIFRNQNILNICVRAYMCVCVCLTHSRNGLSCRFSIFQFSYDWVKSSVLMSINGNYMYIWKSWTCYDCKQNFQVSSLGISVLTGYWNSVIASITTLLNALLTLSILPVTLFILVLVPFVPNICSNATVWMRLRHVAIHFYFWFIWIRLCAFTIVDAAGW